MNQSFRHFLVAALLAVTSTHSAAADNAASTCNDNPAELAKMQKQEGFVQLAFDIDRTGKPTNIRVVKATPEGVFDSAAICALSKWKYEPKVVDGKPMAQYGMRVQLDFSLDP